ncbi:hypothetical protein [Metakosakonia massiliensis]|uniref:hypothetical protein n=1 Tax=Phytobacter massiliensis TaxID=1485952 RepID=UPI0012E93A9E
MINAKKIYSNAGDFILLESDGVFYLDVLIPNFYPNSHFDVSKTFILTNEDKNKKEDTSYLKSLAEDIRKDWKKYSSREVSDVKIIN